VADLRGQLERGLADRYRIERELGRGGMATVYLARDLRHGRSVALKVLRPELGASLGPERFQREIRLAARLSHPHILPVFDSGDAHGRLWYSMPYVEGESLRHRLAREPQLAVGEAVRIAGQVAAALAHAHDQGIVHRDIKPENILLAWDPTGGPAHALVADFGIAKALDANGAEKLTETGLSLGTPAYMSPEQAAAGAVDARTDVYALGCVLYEMLAGQPPFTGSTAQAILARHAVDPVPPLRTVRRTIPAPVAAAIERALAKVPADRFASAAEFAAAVAGSGPALGASTLAPPADGVGGQEDHAPAAVRVRRRRVPAALIGLCLLAVMGVIGLVGRADHFSHAIIPSGRVILIFPLSPSQPDTALARLGRDLAATVSAALDGVGGLRTVDRLTALALTAECGETCRGTESTRIARGLGATSLVRGTLHRTGNATRVEFEMAETNGQRTIIRGSATVPEADLDALTDSVAWTLLRGIWRYGEPPSPSLGAVTTRRLPALRAFLEGEGDIVAGRWQDAASAYRAAMMADPGFWLAYQRFLLSEFWLEEEPDSAILDSLRLHREDLPAREALLVEAWIAQADRYDLTIQILGDVVTRFPDHWPAWFMYGDALAHFGGMHGYPRAASRAAFRRAVALHPSLVPAWSHLFLVSAGEDTVVSGLALERLQQLGWFTRWPGEEGGSGSWFRLMDGLGRTGGVVDSSLSSLADDVSRRLEERPGPGTFDFGPEGALWLGFPRAQIELEERARRLGSAPPSAASIRRSGYAWAARGAWQSGLSLLDAYARDSSGLVPSLEAYHLAVVGAWLGLIDPADAMARRASIPHWLGQTPPSPSAQNGQALVLWLDGLLALRLHDAAALRRSQHTLDSIGTRAAVFNARSLAAFALALKGDSASAGRELAAMEWQCAREVSCSLGNYDIAVHHLAAANWLLQAGDTTESQRLLLWHEAWQAGRYWSMTEVLAGLAAFRQGELAEAEGNLLEAERHYSIFLRRTDHPDPPLVSWVKRAHLARSRVMATVARAQGS
jgi:Protein kinase domain